MPIIIYTTQNCGRCIIAKEYLKKLGIPFQEKNLESTSVMVDLVMNNVSVFEAPIMLVAGRYYSFSEMEDLKQFLEAS